MTQGPHLNIDSTILLCQFLSICIINMIAFHKSLTKATMKQLLRTETVVATSSSKSTNMLLHRIMQPSPEDLTCVLRALQRHYCGTLIKHQLVYVATFSNEGWKPKLDPVFASHSSS